MTYEGAFHHAMNRGYDGRPIFDAKGIKEAFLGKLDEYSQKLRIRVFSYCIIALPCGFGE